MIDCAAPAAAPPASSFPELPESWYYLCRSEELRDRPFSTRLLGRRLAAFRGRDGRVAVLDAACSHLGTDIGRGTVVGNRLRCPFHGWEYERDGSCSLVPGEARPPSFARQRVYSVVERHGAVFFFFGDKALFPLPFFFGEDPAAFTAGTPFGFEADCNWYMSAAHAFDERHFLTVHDRRLLGAPRVDSPAPFARRNRYRAELIGRSRRDLFLRFFAGRTVEMSITSWAGTLFFLEGSIGRVETRFLISSQPLEGGRTRLDGMVFARRSRTAIGRVLFDPLDLRVRTLFTHGYLAEEAASLRGPRYRPAALLDCDRMMVGFFCWLAALQGEPGSKEGGCAR